MVPPRKAGSQRSQQAVTTGVGRCDPCSPQVEQRRWTFRKEAECKHRQRRRQNPTQQALGARQAWERVGRAPPSH